jgi:hypothetical protein
MRFLTAAAAAAYLPVTIGGRQTPSRTRNAPGRSADLEGGQTLGGWNGGAGPVPGASGASLRTGEA